MLKRGRAEVRCHFYAGSVCSVHKVLRRERESFDPVGLEDFILKHPRDKAPLGKLSFRYPVYSVLFVGFIMCIHCPVLASSVFATLCIFFVLVGILATLLQFDADAHV